MESRTMAFVNMYAVLGSLVQLCELAGEARGVLGDAEMTVGFSLKGCFDASLSFKNGRCRLLEGSEGCDIKLAFATPEKFNGMIDGTSTPIPVKGLLKAKFLTGTFMKLTDLLESWLRPKPEALRDEKFFVASTTLMLHLVAAAAAQIGNEDSVGRASAGYIGDGIIRFGVADGPSVGIEAKNHRLRALHEPPESFTSYMRFESIRLARELFDGQTNAVACIGKGSIRMGGMIPQIDNFNRILDRVSRYLA